MDATVAYRSMSDQQQLAEPVADYDQLVCIRVQWTEGVCGLGKGVIRCGHCVPAAAAIAALLQHCCGTVPLDGTVSSKLLNNTVHHRMMSGTSFTWH